MAYCPNRPNGERFVYYPADLPDPEDADYVRVNGEEREPQPPEPEIMTDGGTSVSTKLQSKPYRDEETLRELYWDEGLSLHEVAVELGCTSRTVQNWMKRHDIPRRDNGKALRDANRVKYAYYYVNDEGYELWQDRASVEQVRVHQLLACLDHDSHEVFADDTACHHESGPPEIIVRGTSR